MYSMELTAIRKKLHHPHIINCDTTDGSTTGIDR